MAEEAYSPNDGMKSAARRALKWKEEGRRGGTRVGLTRANQIASGEQLSASTVKRMFSFFSRHEVDKKATGFSSGEEGYPSPGRVAWDLWGGDAGFSWSRQKVSSMKKSEYEGEVVKINPRQEFLYEVIEMAVEEFGSFDLSTGPDGVHYAPASKNPFKNEGLVCKNCVFFEGGGGCEIVSEPVEPEGVCKFWIIPGNLLMKSEKVEMSEEIEKVNDLTATDRMESMTPFIGEDESFTDPKSEEEMEPEGDEDEYGSAAPDNDEDDAPKSSWAGFFSPRL